MPAKIIQRSHKPKEQEEKAPVRSLKPTVHPLPNALTPKEPSKSGASLASGKHKGGRGRKKTVELPFDPTSYPEVLNIHAIPKGQWPQDAVYIGRDENDPKGRGRFGNPFVIGAFHGPREEVVARHKRWLASELLFTKKGPQLLQDIRSTLGGKKLLCFCAPLACHGEVLRLIANCPEKELDGFLRSLYGNP